MKLPNWVIPGSAVFFLGACTALLSPIEQSRSIATQAGFTEVRLPDARLRAYLKHRPVAGSEGSSVTVYIESDGAPWRLPDEPPADPTPHKPMVLRMAASDPSRSVAYLGRPCQYLESADLATCNPALWMRGRFSEDAVVASNQAVSRIKEAAGVGRVNIVGYSGGGSMAALVAARREDVACLVTIAAPLDTDAWTRAIDVSPLDYSLNPADVASRLARLPQTHFQGGKDDLVPPATSARFLKEAPGAKVINKADFDHACCWEDAWAQLRSESCLGK
jgi:pimeloyl-ACP methyl ester carboxylesterase